MKKSNQIKELKEKSDEALYKELIELRKKLSELKFRASFRKLKNYHEITQARKKVARIWTLLNERTIEKLSKEINK